MCSRHVSTKERRRAFPFAAGNTDIRPLSRPGKTQRTCATRARIDEAKTARRSAFSPPLFSFLSFYPSLRVLKRVFSCTRVKIGKFFFFVFLQISFSFVTWLFRNMKIWIYGTVDWGNFEKWTVDYVFEIWIEISCYYREHSLKNV